MPGADARAPWPRRPGADAWQAAAVAGPAAGRPDDRRLDRHHRRARGAHAGPAALPARSRRPRAGAGAGGLLRRGAGTRDPALRLAPHAQRQRRGGQGAVPGPEPGARAPASADLSRGPGRDPGRLLHRLRLRRQATRGDPGGDGPAGGRTGRPRPPGGGCVQRRRPDGRRAVHAHRAPAGAALPARRGGAAHPGLRRRADGAPRRAVGAGHLRAVPRRVRGHRPATA